MADTLKVKFPTNRIYIDSKKQSYLEYNQEFIKKFNKTINDTQKFIDNEVVTHLMKYVSYKNGVQMKSIRLGTICGSGIVRINVPYAGYQAYSPRITKRDGIKGTYPFERMKSDKKDFILRQAIAYNRRNLDG